tara:strand:+ start:367 stop:561 length:195 start_codon:yes stop_codon:yes gene_type:complete
MANPPVCHDFLFKNAVLVEREREREKQCWSALRISRERNKERIARRKKKEEEEEERTYLTLRPL